MAPLGARKPVTRFAAGVQLENALDAPTQWRFIRASKPRRAVRQLRGSVVWLL
jgi:hypothetical protein